MVHLLKLEWLKLKSFTIFRVMVILYLIALPSMLLIAKTIPFDPEDMPPFLPTVKHLFMFPGVWEWLAYVANWLSFFFLGFLGVIMVTNEQRNRTLRQNIITGLSRKEYYLSKLYFIFLVCLVVTVYYTLWCLLFGFTHTETIYVNTLTKNSDFILRVFLINLGYMSFGFFLGMLIRRTGIALLLYITYIMVIESILRYGVHFQIIKHRSMHFYPMNVIEDLAPFPFFAQADDFIKEQGFDMIIAPREAMIAASIYILLFFIISYRRLQKSDL